MLAGVAIKVGVMSLLVMIATVVRVLPLALIFGLARVLNRFGLMAGVSDLLGLVNVNLDLEDDLWADDNELADSSDRPSTMEDERTKSSSRFSKLTELVASRLGVMVLPDDWTLKLGSVSPDSNSGTLVVVSSPLHGAVDELSISPSKAAV